MAAVVGPEFLSRADSIVDALESAFVATDAFVHGLAPMRAMLGEMRALSEAGLAEAYDEGALDLDGFRSLLTRLAGYQERVTALQARCCYLPSDVCTGMMFCNEDAGRSRQAVHLHWAALSACQCCAGCQRCA